MSSVVAPFTGEAIATDLISSVNFQKIKVTFGVDGAFTDVTTSSGFPVNLVASTPLAVTGTFWQATQPVSIASPVAVNSTPVASEVHIGQTGGTAANPTANFTRPADTTAYASGDLVANSTTAGSVAPMTIASIARVAQGAFSINRVKLTKTGTSATNASFRVHMFSAAPTVSNGDNGVFTVSSALAGYLGYVDVTADVLFSTGTAGYGTLSTSAVKLASGQDIYALIEARAAYVPISAEVFTVTIEAVQG